MNYLFNLPSNEPNLKTATHFNWRPTNADILIKEIMQIEKKKGKEIDFKEGFDILDFLSLFIKIAQNTTI